MKTNSRKNVQMPDFKMHSETDALRQVTAGRDSSVVQLYINCIIV